MIDDTWTRDEPDSPCVRVCVIHPETELCLGCGRSAGEVARWSSMTPEERREILAVLPARTPRPARRGGAGARRAARRKG